MNQQQSLLHSSVILQFAQTNSHYQQLLSLLRAGQSASTVLRPSEQPLVCLIEDILAAASSSSSVCSPSSSSSSAASASNPRLASPLAISVLPKQLEAAVSRLTQYAQTKFPGDHPLVASARFRSLLAASFAYDAAFLPTNAHVFVFFFLLKFGFSAARNFSDHSSSSPPSASLTTASSSPSSSSFFPAEGIKKIDEIFPEIIFAPCVGDVVSFIASSSWGPSSSPEVTTPPVASSSSSSSSLPPLAAAPRKQFVLSPVGLTPGEFDLQRLSHLFLTGVLIPPKHCQMVSQPPKSTAGGCESSPTDLMDVTHALMTLCGVTPPPIRPPEDCHSLLSSIASFLGTSSPPAPTSGGPSAAAPAASIPWDRLIFFVIDGLGMVQIQKFLPANSFIRTHIVQQVQSLFPATTQNIIPMFSTGVSCSSHSLVSWMIHVPQSSKQICAFKEQDASLLALNLPSPDEAASWHSKARNDTQELWRHSASLSGPYGDWENAALPPLNRRHTGKSVEESLSDVLALAGQQTQQWQQEGGKFFPKKQIHIVYSGEIDSVCHSFYGQDDQRVGAAVQQVDACLQRHMFRFQQLPGRTLLIVTADHGQVAVSPSHIQFAPGNPPLDPAISSTPMAGENRFITFSVPPAVTDQFEYRFRSRFGNAFVLLRLADVDALRLLGPTPMTALAKQHMGSHIAIATGHREVFQPIHPAGEHGGMSPDEVFVPLIVATTR